MSELTREQVGSIEAECLRTLRDYGFVPDGKTLCLTSGRLGILQLGKVDFLSKLGYAVIWTERK